MIAHKEPHLVTLSSGIPGLDEVLGGGFPEYSFNLIAGEPGTGKTTLVHQLLFANASSERPAVYFTAMGEPPLKMLRYQQQLSFFDSAKVGRAIRFVDLSGDLRKWNLDNLLGAITREVDESGPSLVAIDSFRSLVPGAPFGNGDVKRFLQLLAMHLSSGEATTFLIGEYDEVDIRGNPLFTLCDGLVWLYQSRNKNSVVRKLQVRKMRGQSEISGLHTIRLSSDGMTVFPRTQRRPEHRARDTTDRRVATGVQQLDVMMGGGVPIGDSVLLAGPTGVGKSVLAQQFVAKGLSQGERAVVAIFEEHPDDYVLRAEAFGFGFRAAIARGDLKVVGFRLIDLSLDEALLELRNILTSTGAKRFVLDSLTGLELALAPDPREEFREGLSRMVSILTAMGITTYLTMEISESFSHMKFAPEPLSFMAENVILLRYAEINGVLEKVVTVVKMRRSRHSRQLRAIDITPSGAVITEHLRDFRGILTGAPQQVRSAPPNHHR
jgi:circadian clock protein KaiC